MKEFINWVIFVNSQKIWLVVLALSIITTIYTFSFCSAKNGTEITFFNLKFTKKANIRIQTTLLIVLNLLMYVFTLILMTPLLYQQPNCPNRISADEGTVRYMIELESVAVNNKDMYLINSIYSKSATILDSVNDKRFDDPIARYDNLFKQCNFQGAINHDLHKLQMNDSIAIFTCASRGKYTDISNNTTREYLNPPGSNKFIFNKSHTGCWEIKSFVYNIR
jgi:hypothetical protein